MMRIGSSALLLAAAPLAASVSVSGPWDIAATIVAAVLLGVSLSAFAAGLTTRAGRLDSVPARSSGTREESQ